MKMTTLSCILFSAILTLSACSKSANPVDPPGPVPNPPKDSVSPAVVYPVSFSHYTADYSFTTRQDFNLQFDANKQLLSLSIHRFDTAGGNPTRDSSLFTFPVTAPGIPPGSYDYSWTRSTLPYFSYGASEHHVLWYDTQGRIIKDSMTSWSSTTIEDIYFYKTIFGYSNDRIDWTGISYGSSVGALDFSKDTLLLSDGHINSWTHYLIGDPDSSSQLNQRCQYSSVRNPLYNSKLANSIGPLLMYYNLGDFISPLVVSLDISYKERYTQTASRHYTATADSDGNIIQLTGMEPRDSAPTDVWTFKY